MAIILFRHYINRDTNIPLPLQLLIVELGLELLCVRQLAHRLHKVLLDDVITFSADGKHACFGADIAKIGAVKAVGKLANRLIIYGVSAY